MTDKPKKDTTPEPNEAVLPDPDNAGENPLPEEQVEEAFGPQGYMGILGI